MNKKRRLQEQGVPAAQPAVYSLNLFMKNLFSMKDVDNIDIRKRQRRFLIVFMGIRKKTIKMGGVL